MVQHKAGSYPVTHANFCVSNAGKFSVRGGGFYHYETKKKPFEDVFSAFRAELKPGQFTNIAVTPPKDNQEPWRVGVKFYKVDWRSRLAQGPPWVPGMIVKFVPARWLWEHDEWVYSDWVTEPELMPAPTNIPFLSNDFQRF